MKIEKDTTFCCPHCQKPVAVAVSYDDNHELEPGGTEGNPVNGQHKSFTLNLELKVRQGFER